MSTPDDLEDLIAAALGVTERPALVDAQGRPLRPAGEARPPCPRCGAEPRHRRRSSNFGPAHDVCNTCGFAFEELTT